MDFRPLTYERSWFTSWKTNFSRLVNDEIFEMLIKLWQLLKSKIFMLESAKLGKESGPSILWISSIVNYFWPFLLINVLGRLVSIVGLPPNMSKASGLGNSSWRFSGRTISDTKYSILVILLLWYHIKTTTTNMI